MFYYKILILTKLVEPLVYASDKIIDDYNLVDVMLKNSINKGVVLEKIDKPNFKTLEIIYIHNTFYPKYIVDLAHFISKYYVSQLNEALNEFYPFLKTTPCSSIDIELPFSLNEKQQQALEFIDKNQTALLFGDTGSGKTEIYIYLIKEALKSSQSAIMLLPEISLTPQIQKRLKNVFGSLVEVWHSKITKKKKKSILEGIYNKEIRIIVGARSAIFLPFDDLGLIIVDEEHDDSYKSSKKPRINVKDFAIYYAKQIDAKIVLGSATPSINSYYKLPYFRLKGKYHNSKNSIIYDISKSQITQNMLSVIKDTLSKKKQIIIFLPTRANFKNIMCKSCGSPLQCPSCSVNLSLHKTNNYLKCHYCNYTARVPEKCPVCGHQDMISSRIGTAEVVLQLKELLGDDVSIGKFDRDEIKTQRELKKILKDFNDKKIDILVGTQMVSKGHDYYDVGLSIVMGIDSILYMSDYKSRQKALATAIQVAGRSGRKENSTVLIQTLDSDFFKKYIDDFELLLKDELRFSKDLYPPFTRLAVITFSNKNAQKAYSNMMQELQKLKNIQQLQIVGYKEATIFKLANNFRYQILLRSTNISLLLNALHSVDKKIASIDMDPVIF